MGTYAPPAIAALAVLTPRGAPQLLATAQMSGLVTIWALSGGAGRALCQLDVLQQGGAAPATGELHVTGLCAPHFAISFLYTLCAQERCAALHIRHRARPTLVHTRLVLFVRQWRWLSWCERDTAA